MHKPIQPLNVIPLFAEMRQELLNILHTLTDDEWNAPTACDGWSVRDVASHILSDDIGYLSRHRDQDGILFPADDWGELIANINRQNDEWVRATKRISRKVLMMLLRVTGEEFQTYIETVDPQTDAPPVSWASDAPAPMWLQIARELTEFWMHHQHIADAVRRDSLRDAKFMYPILTAFAHALPRAYMQSDAPENSIVRIAVTDVGSWVIVRENGAWLLYADTTASYTTHITVDRITAWQIYTKGIAPTVAQSNATIEGDMDLAKPFFETVAILA